MMWNFLGNIVECIEDHEGGAVGTAEETTVYTTLVIGEEMG